MNDKIIQFLENLSDEEMYDLHYHLDVRNTWERVKTEKNPIDAWKYQEIIYSKQPDVIIECGTFIGGSALYLNTILDKINNGKIITIDINKYRDFIEPRITFIQGNSVSEEIFKKVKNLIHENDKVMVILDSDHLRKHVLEELEMYSELVSSGQYLIVEDTFYNRVIKEGPLEAINQFFKNNNNFSNDLDIDRFSFLSANHKGYLLKK